MNIRVFLLSILLALLSPLPLYAQSAPDDTQNTDQIAGVDFSTIGALSDEMVGDQDGKGSIALCVKAGKTKAQCEKLWKSLDTKDGNIWDYINIVFTFLMIVSILLWIIKKTTGRRF